MLEMRLAASRLEEITRRHAYAALDDMTARIVKIGGEPMSTEARDLFADIIHARIYQSLYEVLRVAEPIPQQ